MTDLLILAGTGLIVFAGWRTWRAWRAATRASSHEAQFGDFDWWDGR